MTGYGVIRAVYRPELTPTLTPRNDRSRPIRRHRVNVDVGKTKRITPIRMNREKRICFAVAINSTLKAHAVFEPHTRKGPRKLGAPKTEEPSTPLPVKKCPLPHPDIYCAEFSESKIQFEFLGLSHAAGSHARSIRQQKLQACPRQKGYRGSQAKRMLLLSDNGNLLPIMLFLT